MAELKCSRVPLENRVGLKNKAKMSMLNVRLPDVALRTAVFAMLG